MVETAVTRSSGARSSAKGRSAIFSLNGDDRAIARAASVRSDFPAPQYLVREQDIERVDAAIAIASSIIFLLRLAQEEANLSLKINNKLSELILLAQLGSQPQRTIKQLFEAAEEQEKQETIRQKQEAEVRPIKALETLAKREADAWKDIERLLENPQAQAYDRAVKLLLKLQYLALYQNRKLAFRTRLNQIHEQLQ